MSNNIRYAGIVYGPVLSRRLGLSLGVNLLGTGRKICTFDCKYCERGWTESYNAHYFENKIQPDLKTVIEALNNILDNLSMKPEYITFSGNGEPTLHPEFSEIIDEVIKIRNEKYPEIKITVLSNSSTLDSEKVIRTLDKLDEKIMKLDAGNEETFSMINSPLYNITLNKIVEKLKGMKNVTIQSLFANGREGNYSKANIYDWIEKLKIIKPKNVQIYTLDRGYPSDNIYPLELNELEYIESLLKLQKIDSKIYH